MTTIPRARLMEMLIDTGRDFFDVARRAIERNERVDAVFATCTAEGVLTVCILTDMPPTAEQRGILLKALIKQTNAVGFCFVCDGYMRDPASLERVGEALNCTVQVDGIAQGFGLSQCYTRDPVVFAPMSQGESELATPMFPPVIH